MLFSVIILLTLASVEIDQISAAEESYKNIESYQVTLRSKGDNSSEIIRYYYKKPGFVKMEFINPFNGSVLVYSPLTKEVSVRPFGFSKSFVLTLSPYNKLIKSSKGHRVDASDIGELLKMVRKLQDKGITETISDENIGERTTSLISVKGKDSFAVEGIHRCLLWLDKKTFLPLRVSSYDYEGNLIEDVLMDDLEINLEFPESFFNIKDGLK